MFSIPAALPDDSDIDKRSRSHDRDTVKVVVAQVEVT